MEFIKNVLTGELTGKISIAIECDNIHCYPEVFNEIRKITTYITIDTKQFEKLETEYRALVQENEEKLHNYKDCYTNNLSCDFEPCREYKSELNSKYIEQQ